VTVNKTEQFRGYPFCARHDIQLRGPATPPWSGCCGASVVYTSQYGSVLGVTGNNHLRRIVAAERRIRCNRCGTTLDPGDLT
jgi:hypothetical protein